MLCRLNTHLTAEIITVQKGKKSMVLFTMLLVFIDCMYNSPSNATPSYT